MWAIDPTIHISQYAHTAWRIQDGVFSGAPSAITQTADGYLWIGTQNGLFRFDGVRFMPLLPANGQLLSSGIFSLLSGTDGSLWIGTGVNLARLKDSVLTNFSDAQGRVNAIIEDHNGTVWITRSRVRDENGPLCQVMDTRLRCEGKAEGITTPYAGPLIEDSEGNLWIGSANILTRWRAGSSTAFAPPGLKHAENLSGIQALAVTRDGMIWSGTNRTGPGLGLQQMIRERWKPFVAPGLNGERLEVAALFVDAHNTLWVGTVSQGVYRIREGKAERFSSADGLSGDSVTAFYEDREGNLWVATTEGIDSFRDVPVLTFSSREGLSSNLAYSVLAARDGTVWIGNHGSLDYLRGDKLNSIRPNFPVQRVTSLFEDHSGQLWVGIDNGLYVHKEGRFESVAGAKDRSIGTVIAITEDRDHNIWAEAVGKPTRLVRIQDRKVREELSAPGMPVALSLAADPGGGIWLGLANGGLARYQGNHLETFPVGNTQNSRVSQIVVRPDGSVFGATSAGLVYWRNGTVRTLTTQNGLPCDNVYSLLSDADYIWLYSQCGLIRVANTELEKWWDDGHTVVSVTTFNVFEGARPWGTAFQPHASRSPDGRLWFVNETVVQTIDPNHLSVNAVPPPVQVEQIVADHRIYSLAKLVNLPALTRDLEIDYTALSFVVPQKVRFRYKLVGHDSDWQEPGTRRQAFYNDLRPGHYRFVVTACNNDGVWNNAGSTLEFILAPAWYQAVSFRLLCVASGGFLVWVFYRLRVRQIANTINMRFDERLLERTRIAREFHDTFIQTIQGSKIVADDALDHPSDPTLLHQAIKKLSVWLGQALSESRAAVNSLRASTTERNDLAEALRRVTTSSFVPGTMTVRFSVTGDAEEMHPIVRDEVYRIGYEAISNACAHSRAGQLEVEVKYADTLTLRVGDNGAGIDPAIADRGKDGHFGLRGMRERADRISAELILLSTPGLGTEVKLVVPGNVAFKGKLHDEKGLIAWFRARVRRLFRALLPDQPPLD